MDDTASIQILEAAMRAVTFYLDVHVDCARRIVAVEGAVAAICKFKLLKKILLCFALLGLGAVYSAFRTTLMNIRTSGDVTTTPFANIIQAESFQILT